MATAAPAARRGLADLLSLYRRVLRVHRAKLPPPMRALGDGYIKSELRRHLDAKTTEAQWGEFAAQWRAYLSALEGRADADVAHGAVPPLHDADSALTAEQRKQMERLKEAAKDLGGGAGDEAPPSGGRG